jgi:excisionase family DNA binding protein
MSGTADELMTPQEVAHYLRVSKNKVYNLVKREDMPAYAIGGHLRFSKEQIDNWLLTCCVKKATSE